MCKVGEDFSEDFGRKGPSNRVGDGIVKSIALLSLQSTVWASVGGRQLMMWVAATETHFLGMVDQAEKYPDGVGEVGGGGSGEGKDND